MKRIAYFFIIAGAALCQTTCMAQDQVPDSLSPHDSSTPVLVKSPVVINPKSPDTVKKQKARIRVSIDSLRAKRLDSSRGIPGQVPLADSLAKKVDSTAGIQKPADRENFIIHKMLLKNRYINIKDPPVYFMEMPRHPSGKEFLFYALCTVLLLLGIFKTVFSGYFKNLFRVYFNTSLRQTQLSDQLEQAKLPSFLMNIFFTITTGIYIWLLFNEYHPPRLISSHLLLPFCILIVGILYFLKFCLLKFMGWVSDIRDTTDNYIFAIFLVNKITGIVLVPIIILLAFLNSRWVPVITNASLMILGLFFLSRYIKSYGAIEKKIPLNPFHFIIYIIAAEVIPLLIIYKVAVDYLI